MKNFRFQKNAEEGETAAALISAEFGDEYDRLYYSELKNQELMAIYFSFFESFSHSKQLRETFVFMNLFDILIGNQDRHAHNWQVLFINSAPAFAPLYDNGASLGWQLPEEQLKYKLQFEAKMNKFYKDAKVKMGMDNKENPRINARQVLKYIVEYYPGGCKSFYQKLESLRIGSLQKYLKTFPLLSDIRKQFIIEMVRFRRMKILGVFREGGVLDESN